MNITAIREGARVAALIAVLVVAAVLGTVAGTALNGRSGIDAGAATSAAGMTHGRLVLAGSGASAADEPRGTITSPTPR